MFQLYPCGEGKLHFGVPNINNGHMEVGCDFSVLFDKKLFGNNKYLIGYVTFHRRKQACSEQTFPGHLYR